MPQDRSDPAQACTALAHDTDEAARLRHAPASCATCLNPAPGAVTKVQGAGMQTKRGGEHCTALSRAQPLLTVSLILATVQLKGARAALRAHSALLPPVLLLLSTLCACVSVLLALTVVMGRYLYPRHARGSTCLCFSTSLVCPCQQKHGLHGILFSSTNTGYQQLERVRASRR